MKLFLVFLCFCCLFVLFSFTSPYAATQENGFPLLLSPEEFAALDSEVCLVDVRSAEVFLERRIPGAVWFAAREFSEIRDGISGGLPSADSLLALLAQRGIGQDMPVVLYGANDNMGDLAIVARVFWALDWLGYPQVAILDGGLSRWVSEERETASGAPDGQRPSVEIMEAASPRRARVTKADVVAARNAGAVLVDARLFNQYDGSAAIRGIARRGHIPGAHNIPYSSVVSGSHAIFKPLSELEEALYPEGISRSSDIIVYCNTGMLSATIYFAYRLAGHESIANYDGSMREWAADAALPVSTDANESN